MTPYMHRIETPAAWTGPAIGGKVGLTHRLTPAQIAAFDAAIARTRHLRPQEATADDFDSQLRMGRRHRQQQTEEDFQQNFIFHRAVFIR